MQYSAIISPILRIALMSTLFSAVTLGAQDSEKLCPNATIYENHNQVDYGPLELPIIQGRGVVRRDSNFSGYPVGGACLSLFMEDAHQWVETKVADSEGRFRFDSIKPGRYRLVVRAPSLCIANIPLIVIDPSKSERVDAKHLLIDFLPLGISLDEGSFGELISK